MFDINLKQCRFIEPRHALQPVDSQIPGDKETIRPSISIVNYALIARRCLRHNEKSSSYVYRRDIEQQRQKFYAGRQGIKSDLVLYPISPKSNII